MTPPPITTRRNRPQLRTIEPTIGERHASWLELFFDLVFVLAVAQVTRVLTDNSDPAGLLKYAVLFVPIWWSWVGFTFYADRFETEEAEYRILMFTGMLTVAAFSLCVGSAFTPAGDMAAILSYVLVRLVLIMLYARAAYFVPLARSYCAQFIKGFGVASLLWLGSLFLPAPYRYIVWGVAMLLELGTPFLNRRNTSVIPIDRSHIPERLGLFTIIVLGEAVIATTMGASRTAWTISAVATAALGFMMASSIWWINFDFVEDRAVLSRQLFPRFVYLYGHYFIVASIVAVGVGVEHAIKETSEPHLHLASLALIGGGIAVYLTTITMIKIVSKNCNLFTPRVASILIALLMIFFGGLLPPVASITGFFLLLAAGVWLETHNEVEVEEEAGETGAVLPCEHASDMIVFEPRSTEGCEECVKNNYKWVHLRLCLGCGHVGCCESSIYTHAAKHHQASGHPVIASLEPNENWAWCYEDDRFVPLASEPG